MVVSVYSGIEYLGQQLEKELEHASVLCEPVRFIIVDKPIGWAFLDQHLPKMPRALILSDNPCPEYHLRLLERNPVAIAGEISAKAVLDTIRGIQHSTLAPSRVKSRLTPSERICLHLAVLGKTNKEIAVVRDVTEGVVKNSLNAINHKLGLKTRIQLVHYYHGNWHLLEGWQPTEPSPFYAYLLKAQ